MTEDTVTKANDNTAKRPAARLLSAVSKLKSAAVGALARHQQREALLRVHRATRQDVRINGTGTDDAARGLKPPRA